MFRAMWRTIRFGCQTLTSGALESICSDSEPDSATLLVLAMFGAPKFWPVISITEPTTWPVVVPARWTPKSGELIVGAAAACAGAGDIETRAIRELAARAVGLTIRRNLIGRLLAWRILPAPVLRRPSRRLFLPRSRYGSTDGTVDRARVHTDRARPRGAAAIPDP